ncbi:MAG: helicase-related protein [Candidatus Thorarchaeota archaeon]
MTRERPAYAPRKYQSYVLERIRSSRGRNVLVELDCGLGKRFITHQLVAEIFPELSFLIVVHSTSSLVETLDYLRREYGIDEGQLGELSSRISSPRRLRVLMERRVVVTTPQVLTRVLEDHPEAASRFDAVIVNEIDTLVRRVGDSVSLVYPWSTLFSMLEGKWIVGMSGTLRDDHAVFNDKQLEIRNELVTLKQVLLGAELITMDELYGSTDVEQFLEPTVIRVVHIDDRNIRAIALVLDELIQSTRSEIVAELVRDGNEELVEGDIRRIHLMLSRLPVSDEVKGRYSALLMLRKYVYGMPPSSFIRMFHNEYLAHYFNLRGMASTIPEVSSKTVEVLRLSKSRPKTVVLTSYLEMVDQIRETLERSGISVLTLTGRSHDKADVLNAFRNDPSARVLVMSPVGERDLDMPQADLMIVCDVINTPKTMYQKFKRTRGGEVVILAYAGTSETRKVERLVKSVLDRYPWSTTVSPETSNSDDWQGEFH